MIKNKSDIRLGDDEVDLSGFFKEIRRRWLWFLAALILCMSAAFLYIKFSLPVYEATSTVLVKEVSKPTVNMEDFIAGDLFGDQANIATEKGILGSRSVMKETIRQLNLQVSYINTSVFPNQPLYNTQPFAVITDTTFRENQWLYDIPFSITLTGKDKYLISVESDEESSGVYSYTKEHRFGEPVKTSRFSFIIERTTPYFSAESKDYEFIINSESR